MNEDKYCSLRSPLPHWDLAGKQVFVRADLNVPLKQGKIIDDTRLQKLRPTLDAILTKGGFITLATHIGRPKQYQQDLSTSSIIAPWLYQHGYDNRITLLENLRFFTEEMENSITFAKQLAQGMDYYLDDAFGSVHRSSTSLTTLPQLFDPEHRGIGLLIEQELATLSKLKYQAKKPFVLILGGEKVADKLPFLKSMLDHVTDILLCPAIVGPFLHTKLNNTDNALVDEAQSIIALAQKKQIKLHLPQDYLISQPGAKNIWIGPFSYRGASTIGPEDLLVAIGPKTIAQWEPIIMQAETIFFNGPMGNLDKPETIQELKVLLQTIAQSPAWSIVGGGDSLAALQAFHLKQKVDFCSTGGGATLAYLSGQPLPALDALLTPFIDTSL